MLWRLVETALFTFTSLTLRECWHVVLGTNYMLLTQKEIKESMKKEIA